MASTSGFTHLHLHSQYSLLDGAIRLHDLIPAVKEKGMDSVAVTDHGNMYGAVDFYNTAKKHDIKPIFGCEAYITGDKPCSDRSSRESYHLILLAKDNEGYKNLTYLVSMGFLEGFYYKPRIDKELLRKHSKGIYGLSACLGGVINKTWMREGEEKASAVAKEYKDIFEPGHFFLEVQDNGYEEQVKANQFLMNLSELYDIPLCATADSHYLTPDESAAHEVLMCIQQNSSLQQYRQRMKHSDQLYVKTPEEMWNSFGSTIPQAVENTTRISQSCNVELNLSDTYLPNYKIPKGYNLESYLEKVAKDGLKARIKHAQYAIDQGVYKERLEHELGIILNMGFAGYFLIVWDFIKHAKERRIPVGPGRGSGAGSIVAWALGITNIDPIPYDLIFERFLNPERVSMPDFDIDFCQERRGEVIDYVTDKYGSNNVGQIVTYSQLSAKSVIKDVGRVMEVPFGEINELTKLIPGLVNGRKVTIDQALDIEPKLKEIQKEKPIYKQIIKIARDLEGLNRQTGMHAAGLVISDKPLWDYVPVCRGKEGEKVTQFAKDEVEMAGLVKFDFLGLKTLTVVAKAENHIRKRTDDGPLGANKDFDIEEAPIDDPAIYKLIASGDTDGVFQLESSGFKELLKRLKPDCFEDIVAAVALYRPGPLDAGMVDDYIDRKHGRTNIDYPHPVCEPILKTTYGVIVYQEQVMRIAVDLCGFSMGEADVLRKAMGKKKADVMAKMRKKFVDGAHDLNGMDKKPADELFTQIEKFAGYAFNKSHSAAYALISYHTAYLKYYFQVEFMAALLSTEMRDQDDIVKYIQSARERGIDVLPPDVNRSERDFTVVHENDEHRILFGLGAVKGVGDAAIESILSSREQGGPFTSIYNLCERVETKRCNKKVLDALIRSGGFDDFQRPRAQLIQTIEKALDAAQAAQKDRASGQTNIFAMMSSDDGSEKNAAGIAENYPNVEEWHEKEKLASEKKSLGFYITGHPLDRYKNELPRICPTRTIDLPNRAKRNTGRFCEVVVGGVVSALRERPLKSGKGRMAFITLEDLYGRVEVLVFSRVFSEAEHILKSDEPIVIKGALLLEGDDNTELKIRASEIELLSDARTKVARGLNIKITAEQLNPEVLQKLKDILGAHKGALPARLTIKQADQFETVMALPQELSVAPSEEIVHQLDRLFGKSVAYFV